MSDPAIDNAIFVDEAGDLGLQSKAQIAVKPYFTFGYVYCEKPKELRKRLRRLLKRLHIKNRYPPHLGELKFYIPYSDMIQKYGYTVPQLDQYNKHMPMIRTRAINLICQYTNGAFVAIIDKRTPQPSWSSEELGNFVFAQTLIVNVMNVLQPSNIPTVLYDQGRLSPAKTIQFKTYVTRKDSYFEYKGLKLYRGSLSPPVDTSSVREPGIWAADLLAGAFFHKYSNKEHSYANMFSHKAIGRGERRYWF